MTYYQSGSVFSTSFFMVPKALLSEQFSQISANAKLMFIQMLDRCKLSIKNNWIDETKNIFIIYPVDQLAKTMNLKKSKVHMLLNELENAQLIKRKRTGRALPNKIYLANLDAQMDANKNTTVTGEKNQKNYESMYKNSRCESYQYSAYENNAKSEEIKKIEEELAYARKMDSIKKKNNNYEEMASGMPASLRGKLYETLGSIYDKFSIKSSKERATNRDFDFRGCGGQKHSDIHNSGHQNKNVFYKYGDRIVGNTKNTIIDEKNQYDIQKYEGQKTTDIHKCGDHTEGDVHKTENMMSTIVDTNKNNNINNNNIIINACARAKDELSSSSELSEVVKCKINYGALVTENPDCVDAINTIVDVMTDVAAQNQHNSLATLPIGERDIPYKDIAAKYSMLRFCDINNVLHAAKGTNISNPKRYYLVCLYRKAESLYTLKSDSVSNVSTYRNAFNNFQGRDLTSTIAQLEKYCLGM